MHALQIVSVDEPFRADPELASRAMRLLTRAEFLGWRPRPATTEVSAETIAAIGRWMRRAKLPTARWEAALSQPDQISAERWRAIVDAMNEQLEMSPLPANEWPPLLDTLGEDLLAQLVGVSVSSVRRYHAGARTTPQDVAERLHFLALVVSDLAGSYNDYGIRRWFTRPRTALGDRRPIDLLGAGFAPDADEPRQVQRLAASLIAAGAA